MRFLLVLLLAGLLFAGPAAANTYVGTEGSIFAREAQGDSCSSDPYPGEPGATLIGIVELSGHGEVFIDGKQAELAGTGVYKGEVANWYRATEGTRQITISQQGYTNYLASRRVCTGKVTYAYYDQAAHVYPGMTRPPGTPLDSILTTTTTVPATTATTVQSSGYNALKSALGSSASADSGGSLSVTTDPSGATIYIDDTKQGISPATIPGIPAGSHTLTLKLEGYDDLSLPIVISAGRTQYYSSALQKSQAAAATTSLPVTAKSSAPGMEIVAAACLIAAVVLTRRTA